MGICHSTPDSVEEVQEHPTGDVVNERPREQEADYRSRFRNALPQTNQFYKCVCENDVEQVKHLLSLGENPNHTYAVLFEGGSFGSSRYSNHTALGVACNRGYSEIVALLLTAKSDPTTKSSWGDDNRMAGSNDNRYPPLGYAVKNCGQDGTNFDIVQQLLDAKVDPREAICEEDIGGYNYYRGRWNVLQIRTLSPTLKSLLLSVVPAQARDYGRVLLKASSSAKHPNPNPVSAIADIPLQLLFRFFQIHPGLTKYVGGIMLGFVQSW